MSEKITLDVNGKTHVIDTDPEMPLLYALRNDIGLNNPHFGCGLAQCGACTVHLDGVAMRSCGISVSEAVGKQITTIEGLASNGALHKVQQAWVANDVPQCGYCQSGMMIAAVELLSKNKNPSVAQIKHAFTNTPPSPHLCRCGTYAAIIDAVQRAAKVMTA